MEEQAQPSIFEDIHDPFAVRRKYLVPAWIRVFAWIFAIWCPIQLLFTLCFAALSSTGALSQYVQLSGANFITVMGVVTLGATVLKGTAAIGLLTEKNWAVKLCIADGILSIALCVYSLVMYPWVATILVGTTNLFYFLKTKYDDLVLRVCYFLTGTYLAYTSMILLTKNLPEGLHNFKEDSTVKEHSTKK